MQNQTITNQPSNNQVTLVGTITSKYTFSHEVFGEGFYTMQMDIKRNSGAVDTICCMISDRLADISCDPTGCRVKVRGQFRSYNQQVDGNSHLRLTVFIREIENVEETQNSDYNEIELHGFLCKDPIYRVTPKGYEITDLLLAVNRVSPVCITNERPMGNKRSSRALPMKCPFHQSKRQSTNNETLWWDKPQTNTAKIVIL